MSAGWFHGTDAELSPGDRLVPGVEIGRDNWPGMDNNWGVWITPSAELAAKYGSHVYAVRPVGEVIDWADENGWEKTADNDEFVCDGAVILGADR